MKLHNLKISIAAGILAAAIASAGMRAMAEEPMTHRVESGETLYGISKKFGVSIDSLIELNPSVRDGVKAGSIIIIRPGSTKQDSSIAQGEKRKINADGTYKIGQGETLYRIAEENGITVDDILRANPRLDALNYQAGETIIIPSPDSAKATRDLQNSVPSASGKNKTSKRKVSSAIDERYAVTPPAHEMLSTDEIDVEGFQSGHELYTFEEAEADAEFIVPLKEQYNMAIILPFMLNGDAKGRETAMYLDFYRGMLLAADQLKDSGDRINIRVFDSAASADTIKALMKDSYFDDVEAIIAPNDERQLRMIADMSNPVKTFVFNPFVTRSTLQNEYSNVVQMNIPKDQMQAKAIDAFMVENNGKIPVFIARTGAEADMADFVDSLKGRLKASAIPYEEITYANALTAKDLSKLSNSAAYVFIPASSSGSEFAKLAPAIKDFRAASTVSSDISIFGYPQWVTFRGDLRNQLNQLNATIYNRFYDDESNPEEKRVREAFKENFYRDMIDGAPSMALMGYDSGMFIMNGMRRNGGDFHSNHADHTGLQSTFDLSDSNIPGLVNTSVVLVKFSESSSPKVIYL